jgi:hypothetical protein
MRKRGFRMAWRFYRAHSSIGVRPRLPLLIPIIVGEGSKAPKAFRRSNELVRGHTARVVVELVVSGILFVVVWTFALGVLLSGLTFWAAIPIACAMLALGAPVTR